MMQKVARRRTRTHAWDVATILLQIIRNLQFVKLGGDPKVGKEQNHQTFQQKIDRSTMGQLARDLVEERHTQSFAQGIEYLLRKHQDGLRENDRHDSRVVDPQRHERRTARNDLSTHRPLRILHRYLPLGLSYCNHPRNHSQKQQHQSNTVENGKPRFGSRRREKHFIHRLQCLRHPRHNANRNDQRNAITNPPLRYLLTQPHQQECSGGEDHSCLDAIPPNIIRLHQDTLKTGQNLLRILPANGHDKALPNA